MKQEKFKKTPISLALAGLLFAGVAQADSPGEWGRWGPGGFGGFGYPGGPGGDPGAAGDQNGFLQSRFDNSLGDAGVGGLTLTSIADMNALQAGFLTGFYSGVSSAGDYDIDMGVFFGEGSFFSFFEPNSEDGLFFGAFGEIDGNSFASSEIGFCDECGGNVSGNFFGGNAASAGGSFNVNGFVEGGGGEVSAQGSFNIPQTSLEGGFGGPEGRPPIFD